MAIVPGMGDDGLDHAGSFHRIGVGIAPVIDRVGEIVEAQARPARQPALVRARHDQQPVVVEFAV